MRPTLLLLPLFVVTTCPARQSSLPASEQRFVVSQSKTISVDELKQRNQSNCMKTFADAKLASRAGDSLRAIKLFEKVLKKDPLFSDARNDLAIELIVTGQTDRATKELERAVQLDPRFLMGYNNLGVILCSQKKYVEAEAAVRRSLNINPDSGKANLLLALALNGQSKRGRETQHALEIAARSSSLAIKLLKDWFDVSDVASAALPN